MVKNKLDQVFQNLKRYHRKAMIGYLAAGVPSFSEQEQLIKEMGQSGMNILEIGMPFSDPVADGPTIQWASQQSLQKGMTVRKLLQWIKRFNEKNQIPIVIMGYLNPLLQYGLNSFSKEAGRAGVVGVIVPDVIPEEAKEFRHLLSKENIHMIHMISPTTPIERQRRIAKLSSGFLYAVSVTGVTGARTQFPPETKSWLKKLKKISRVPVCVGFGISGPQHIRALRSSVDGFIVGSALINIIRDNASRQRKLKLGKFVRSLSKECD